ncbi:T9SS type A sorting domain-containing protein [Lewinella sp. LCG006]|uniref:T9SS type A sorting domain-containing protein n=1 Tax=Lewinella sp. LCG006 TaxID=3231911 RepID=UPI0034602E8F
MKNLYVFAFTLLTFGALTAQSTGISGCNDPNGGIQIAFEEALGCNAGALAGMSAIGFHSGANMWSSVVDWNASGAVTASNNGSDVFTAYIADPNAYYGTSVDNIWFVFNQGPTDPNNPWSAEGKRNDNGNCADFSINLSEITETCAISASTKDLLLELDFQVLGNPFTEKAIVNFANLNGDTYTVQLNDAMGRTLRTYTGINTNQLTVERDNLSSGVYFLTFINEAGKFATLKLFAR